MMGETLDVKCGGVWDWVMYLGVCGGGGGGDMTQWGGKA